jgi:hypothetical protein
MQAPITEFSADDENRVDQDFDTSYWPGVTDQASAATLSVDPGSAADIGVLTVRKGPRYRIHFVVRGCDPAEQLELPVQGALDLPYSLTSTPLPCKDLLFRGFRSGSYRFIATTKRGATVVLATIADRGVKVPVNLIPNADVSGRIIAAAGVPLPDLWSSFRRPGMDMGRLVRTLKAISFWGTCNASQRHFNS